MATTEPAGSGAAPNSTSEPRRVLVVDDEPGVRTVLGRALARWDYEVFLADCGADALAQMAREPGVDVLVSDVTMPVMTGLELAAEVRVHYPGLPILFVTATALPAAVLDDHLVDVVYKPVRMADIRSRLDALLDRVRVPSWAAASADAVQPAHGDALGGMAEGLELVVPGLPEQHL